MSAPNHALHLTAYSVRCAPASSSGRHLAFGCAGTNRHDVKGCKSQTVKGSPPTLAPSHAWLPVTVGVKR